MKKRTLNKLLSLLLTLVIVLGMGIPVFAEGEESDGDLIAPQATDLTVTFSTDEHSTVDLYYTKDDYSSPNETNVTTAKVRGKSSTDIDNSGEGQVNFRVNVEDGYTYTVTPTPVENYNNCKGEDETGVADIWRITKITGDLTVTITTTKVENPDETPDTPTVDNEINADTVWSYLDDGSDPAAGLSDRTGWTSADYDVSGWKTAAGAFGAKGGAIADLGGNCTPNVLLNQYKADGTTDIEAFFFRTTVNVTDPSSVTAITGSVIYDDAATVYINGTKIAGFDDDDITANLQYGGSNASAPKTGEINITDAAQIASLLKSGSNIVAVELHQARANSSDIYFEMPALTFETGVSNQESQESISISMGADETQCNFTWYCSQEGNGVLYLAKNSELVNGEMPEGAQTFTASSAAATNKSGYYSNKVTVTGLENGVAYAYQLVNGTAKSKIRTFTTGTSGDFSFAFAGDPQIGASGNTTQDTDGWEKSLNIIAENDIFSGVDFLLSAGDQVNTANNETQYDGYLNHEALYSMPVATVVGNHDSTSVAYDEHFNVPNKSSTLGLTDASADYYFVYNNVLFMVLNSNNTSTAEHEAFIKQAIEEAGDGITWKVVAFHHSIYSVASHALETGILNRRTGLVPVFQALDIDVVLMGHDHVYCRTYMMDGLTPMTDASIYDDENYSSITDPTGILYVTVNSASGSKFYSIQNAEFPYSRIMNQEKVPNVSRVDVSDDQFTITTYRTNDMSVVDKFTINRTVEAEKYEITVESSEGGTAKASASSAVQGTEVTLTATPEEGYHFQTWEVVSGDVSILDNQFTMPNKAVTIKAVFALDDTDDGSQSGGTDQTGGSDKPVDTGNNNGNTTSGSQSGSTTQNSSDSPRTGDNSNIILYVVAMLVALGCGVVLMITCRRRKIK